MAMIPADHSRAAFHRVHRVLLIGQPKVWIQVMKAFLNLLMTAVCGKENGRNVSAFRLRNLSLFSLARSTKTKLLSVGVVLQEQNRDAVATELGILGMDGSIDRSRQPETYSYFLAKKLMKEAQQKEAETLGKELDEYMHDDKTTLPVEEENGQGFLKRERPVKDRLGERQEMKYKGRYDTTEEDSEEKVADGLSVSLVTPYLHFLKYW